MHFFETASGREIGNIVLRAWGANPNWLADNRSLVYTKLQKLSPGAPVTEVEQKVRAYLHILGSDPEKDAPVFGWNVVPSIPVDPRYFAAISVPADSNEALGVINSGVSPNSEFYIEAAADLGRTNSAWRKVADLSEDVQDAELHGDNLYLLTYKNALRYKVIRLDAHKPDIASAETVVPPTQAVVNGIHPAQDALYVELLDGGVGRVMRVACGPHPKAEEIALPFKGSAFVSTDPRVPGALLYMTSWTKAFRIEAYDPKSKSVSDTSFNQQVRSTTPKTWNRLRSKSLAVMACKCPFPSFIGEALNATDRTRLFLRVAVRTGPRSRQILRRRESHGLKKEASSLFATCVAAENMGRSGIWRAKVRPSLIPGTTSSRAPNT